MTTSKNMGQPVKNRFKVQKGQWAKWNNHAKKVFNEMMLSLRPSMQFAFLHPDCPPMAKEHWATTRWNASWNAACVANDEGYMKNVTVFDTAKKKAKRRVK